MCAALVVPSAPRVTAHVPPSTSTVPTSMISSPTVMYSPAATPAVSVTGSVVALSSMPGTSTRTSRPVVGASYVQRAASANSPFCCHWQIGE